MKMAMLRISAYLSCKIWLYWIRKTNPFARQMLCNNMVKVGMKETNQGSLNAIIKHACIEQRAGLNPADPAESAGMEDAQIMPSMEVSVSNTGQDINIVLLKDALIMQFRKESVGDTGKGSIRTKNVCMKDAPTAPTKQKQVESAPGMGQSTKSARMKDVQIMPSREEPVGDMRTENWGHL
mmetsp:Transcript_22197/g.39081  ORF Transcript_22197/g.39081 Transcript_22197/m.39081 type:complete len:181 (-) Transcript_22197:255-797(-)